MATAETSAAARWRATSPTAELWDEVVATAGAALRAVHLDTGVYGHVGPIEDLPLDVYRRTSTPTSAAVVLGPSARPGPACRRRRAIVVTASVAGVIASGGNPLYTLTKQAVAGFVAALARTLEADGISIDAVCPGVVRHADDGARCCTGWTRARSASQIVSGGGHRADRRRARRHGGHRPPAGGPARATTPSTGATRPPAGAVAAAPRQRSRMAFVEPSGPTAWPLLGSAA